MNLFLFSCCTYENFSRNFLSLLLFFLVNFSFISIVKLNYQYIGELTEMIKEKKYKRVDKKVSIQFFKAVNQYNEKYPLSFGKIISNDHLVNKIKIDIGDPFGMVKHKTVAF